MLIHINIRMVMPTSNWFKDTFWYSRVAVDKSGGAARNATAMRGCTMAFNDRDGISTMVAM